VLFSVPSMPDYGRLSRRTRDELVAGARVEVAPYKKDPADFVLWKPSTKRNRLGEPVGPRPPGWHIECSAMSVSLLGETFDIHAGGLDLIFPHHENEIAQSRSAFGHAIMATYWMHNGFVNVSGEKMSKSLGNFFTVHELLDQYPGDAIRLLLMTSHYRQPLDFTHEGCSRPRRRSIAGTARCAASSDARERRAGLGRRRLVGRPQHAAGDQRDAPARGSAEYWPARRRSA
jgi:cysteinyl-tRNA synthetase